MGNVSARDRDYDDGRPKVTLDGIAARVTRVHIKGLVRTKDDVVASTIAPVLKVKQFEELVVAAQNARSRLQEMGCFKGVEIEIDTSEGGGSNDYEVTFAVEELRRIIGSFNTMVGNQEGSVLGGVKLPNLLGRGESLQVEYSHGTKRSNQFIASFTKPIRSSSSSAAAAATVSTSLFQQTAESIPSGYREVGRGGLVDVSFLSAPQVAHNLQLETVWRQLNCLNNSGSSSFAVREHSGHTLKAAVKHVMTVDRRNDPIFPADGSLFRLCQEFAGLGGDVGFFKNEVELQANLPLSGLSKLLGGGGGDPCVLQSSFQCGYLKQTAAAADKTVTLSDNFYLGGPLNVRGFELRGLGPSTEGNAVGGSMYWATGIHLYTPLPFRRSNSNGPSLADLFRTHSFVTAGNLLPGFRYDAERGVNCNLDEAIQNFRLSYGVGLALRLGGIARIELNYCVPVRAQEGDRAAPGLQLGVGVNFL